MTATHNGTLRDRYLQAQGLMKVPTYVLFIIAPLNVVMNYLLVSVASFLCNQMLINLGLGPGRHQAGFQRRRVGNCHQLQSDRKMTSTPHSLFAHS